MSPITRLFVLPASRTLIKPSLRSSTRAFHSRSIVLSSPSPASSDVYEKQAEPSAEPQVSHSGKMTYVVSEPEPASKHYDVPSGAFPNAGSEPKPPKIDEGNRSSTSAGQVAHLMTRKAESKSEGSGETAKSDGGLAERNPPPNDAKVAEKNSRAGIHEAWKTRK